MNEIIFDEQHIGEAAAEFLRTLGDRRHVAFNAPMGAGKTTFISALCRVLGATDEASSPTFSIINEYEAPEGNVYHFDFYRIESVEETIDLGLDDYFDSGLLCLMEWPEKVEGFMPDDTLYVTISVGDDGRRSVKF